MKEKWLTFTTIKTSLAYFLIFAKLLTYAGCSLAYSNAWSFTRWLTIASNIFKVDGCVNLLDLVTMSFNTI